MHGTIRTALALFAAGLLAFGTGCWSSSPERVVQDGPLVGAPPIERAVLGGRHAVVARVPNPGWTLAYDGFERTPGATRVLVTLRRADPTVLVPQVVVEKTVITGVDADEEVALFARVLDHGQRAGGQAYRRVAARDTGE